VISPDEVEFIQCMAHVMCSVFAKESEAYWCLCKMLNRYKGSTWVWECKRIIIIIESKVFIIAERIE
jgi:hypothetical protein